MLGCGLGKYFGRGLGGLQTACWDEQIARCHREKCVKVPVLLSQATPFARYRWVGLQTSEDG